MAVAGEIFSLAICYVIAGKLIEFSDPRAPKGHS